MPAFQAMDVAKSEMGGGEVRLQPDRFAQAFRRFPQAVAGKPGNAGVPQAHPEMRIVRGMAQRKAKRVRRFVQPHAPLQQRAEMEQGFRVGRIERGDAAEAGLGLLETAGLVQYQAQVVERRQVVRLQVQRAAIAADRQFPVARGLLGVAQVLQCFGAAAQGT